MNCPVDKLHNRYNSCECDVLPKGTYYIGDPCYAIGTTEDTYWSKLCKIMFAEQKHNSSAKWNQDKLEQRLKTDKPILENYGLMVSNPSKKDKKFYDVAIYGTAYGDGTYEDVESYTGDYMVDAGIIGAIPVQAIPKNKKTRKDGIVKRYNASIKSSYLSEEKVWFVAGGHFVEFDEEVHCFTDGRYLHFGYKGNHIAIDTDPRQDDEIIEEAIIDNRPWN